MTRATVTFIRRVWDPSPCAGRRTVCICWWRSEEHTSELQSRSDLVCRLLLEKKNYLDIKQPHSLEFLRSIYRRLFLLLLERIALSSRRSACRNDRNLCTHERGGSIYESYAPV